MKNTIIFIIAKQFFKKIFSNKGLLVLWSFFLVVLIYITLTNWKVYEKNAHGVEHHQNVARKSWDNNPDKHPHRMAHFGNFVFRTQHPLRIFDSGIENYTGNAVFLEAHRQNTANFSEASFSTGLVRFGDLNVSLLLQLILPLIIFFIGYATISNERENGTLKLIYIQGASLKEVLLGKSLGLFFIASLFFIPCLIALWSISFLESHVIDSEIVIRSFFISISYLLFYLVVCTVTVIISGKSKSSNKALLSLLGAWLLFFIIVPKTAQVVGSAMHPNPSRIAFKANVEKEVLKQGDSHNPDDPYFNRLRDSVLKVHQVTDVKDLPFNYSGFIMQKGEEQTATIYKNEYQKLINIYQRQNSITNNLVLLNPYLAIKKLSMSLSGTDFDTYINFLTQIEQYRYKQSQYLNDLQMKFISNKAKSSEGKVHVVNKEYWKSLPTFQFQYISATETFSNGKFAILSLLIWLLASIIVITKFLIGLKLFNCVQNTHQTIF